MNILFVLENYFPHIGGVEVVFKTLCEGLAKKGHDITIVTHRPKGTKRKERLNGVFIHRVDCLESRYLFTFLSIPAIARYAKKADLIHTTTFNAAPPAWLVSRFLRKKIILTVHEIWIGRWKELTDLGFFSTMMYEFLERMIYIFRYDHYVCVSHATAKALKKIKPGEPATVIHNGIDYDHFQAGSYLDNTKKTKKELGLQDKYTMLSYGRPGISKGIEYSIMAFKKLHKKIPGSRLVLILSKDPAYKDRYQYMKDLIQPIKDSVILLPPKPWKELPAYLLLADCIVVPSLAEGFGFTAAESCALGIPVVASDTASLPEVVFGKYILVPPKDPDAIAEAVFRIYKGEVKETPKKIFSWEENIKKNEEIYGNLLKKR